MKNNIHLFIVIFFFIFYVNTALHAQCPATPTCNKTAVAGTNYTLTASDVLCISTNYNSGNLTINGGTVVIQSGGTLNVTPSISSGTINIAAGGTLNTDISAGSTATINNCGKISGVRSINPNVTINNYDNNGGVPLVLKQDNGFTLNNLGKNLAVVIDGNPNNSFTIKNDIGATITSLSTTHPGSGLRAGSTITNLGAINITSDLLWEGTINNGDVSGSHPGTITTASGVQIEFRGAWTINNNISSTIQIDKIYLNNLSNPGLGALLSDQSVLSVNTIVGNNILNPIKGIGGCSYFKSYNVFSSTSNQNLFLQVPPGAISYCGPVPVNSAAQTFGIVSVVSNGATPALYRVTVNSSNNSSSINNTFISIRFVSGNQSNGYWKAKLISTSGGTATYDLLDPNGGTYTFDNAATAGTGTFYWTASTFGNAYYAGYDCNNPVLTAKTVTAGPAQTVCANNPTVTLAGDFTSGPGIIWSGGAGTFVPNNTTKNATYTPTAAEVASGSVTLTITATGSSSCSQQSDKVTISFSASPTVNAGAAATVCVNNPAASLVATATNQTSVSWSGGTGTFSAPNSLTTTYNPSAAEKTGNPKTVTLTLTANKAGCNPVTSNVNVTINPSPIVNAGSNRTICKNDSVNLVGSVTNASGGIWSGGTGKFTPNATTLTANYKPSAAELAGSSVVLTLTSTGNGTCLPVTSNMTITLNPAPTAVITAPTSVCDNNPSFNLSSAISGATGQKWIGSGGTFVPNTTASTVTYTPSAAEIAGGFTGVVLETTGGICPPTADTAIVSFNPAPTVDGGLPISICENNPTGTLTGSVVGISTVSWSSPTGGLFSAPSNPITNYTATASDISNGSVTLTVTANKATCLPVTDQVVVTITPKPTVNAGPSRSVCRNNPTATFNGTATGPAGFGVQWTSGGDGTFGSPTSVNTTYTAGPNDLIAGTVTLTLTTTNNGKCSAVSATTTMTFTATPVVTPGNYTVCSNNATVSLNGSVTVASGGQWVGGAGTFTPSRTVLNPTYTPTAAEISSGSLNLTLQSTGNGNCNMVSAVATITFTAAPTLTPVTPVNVCADVPTASISTTKTLATGVLWSGGSGTITNPTALSTTYVPTTSEVNTGSVTLTVTTTGNGTCSPVSSNVQILIAPAPTVNAGSNQVVCGTVSTVSNLTGTITGATGGTWTKVSGTGTFGNANSTSTTYTPSTQDVTNGSVTLKLTSTGNGLCQPVSNTMTITYTPVPSINAGADQIVCSTELPINLSATGSPAAWATSGGSFGNVNSLTTTYNPSAGEIAAGTVTLSISTIPSGACPTKTDQITISIPAGPVVNPGAASQTMCGSLAAYPLNGTVTNATGGIWTTNGTGSFTPNANTLNASYTPSATDRTNGSVQLTLTSTGNGFCQQVSRTITLTITPAIVVSAGPNQTLCADVSGITLNGSVTTATGGIWSITSGGGSIASPTSLITTYTPTAGDITTGSVSFLLTSTGNGSCPAVTSTVTHTLTPAPTLNQGGNQTICGDSAYVQLGATFTIATGVKWTSNGTGTFSPNNVTANARYIPSAADIASGSVTLTATTTGNGTCNPIVKSLTITITPAVSLTIPSTQNVCQNNSTVTLSVSTTATAVNWTTSGTGTFANATSPNTTYAPSAADIASGIVTLTNKTTGNGTCKTQTGIIQVIIAPTPIVDAGLPQTVCSTTSAITLNGTVQHAGGGTWTSNGTGTFANANALSTTYTPTTADTTAGSVIFTLTSTGNGTCTPVAKNVTVTFKKIAIVNAGPDQTICGDSAYVQLAGSVANAGGGIWSRSGTGSFFPSTIDLNAVYSPTAADKSSGSVTITLTSTTNGACPPVSDNMIITITPAPIVTVSSDKTVCANNSATTVVGTATVSSTIKWTTSGTGTFTPNNTTPTATYTPSAIDKAAGSVVLSMLTTANGLCKPAQQYLTLTITPAPTLNAGFDKTICGDSLGVKLDEAVVTTATGVQWTSNGSGVFGPNNTTTQPTYFPSAGDKTTGKVKIFGVTTGNGSCLAVRDTIEITITPIPTVNAGSDISICADTNGVKLAGSSTIAGGVKWTTSGSGIFTPSALVANASYVPSNDETVTLTLTTTNNGACKAVHDDLLVFVASIPIVDAGVDKTLCADVSQVLLGGSVTNATGGSWTTNGSGTFAPSSSTLNPNYTPSVSDLTVGTVVLTLASTGNGLCKQVNDNVTLKFNPVATISAGNHLQVCNTSTTVNVNASSTNVSSVNWQIISGNGSLTTTSTLNTSYNVVPADIIAGSVTLRITGTALSSCSNVSDDVTITFVASPPIDAGNNKSVCSTDFPIQLEGSGSSAKWSGYTGTFSPNDQTLNALYTPSAAEVAAHTVTLTLQTTTSGTCGVASDQVTFTILDGPAVAVDAGTVSKICANTPTVNLSGTTNGVSSTGVTWSTSGSGTFTNGNTLTPIYTPSASDKNGGEVVLTISSTGNGFCNAATDTMHLMIIPAPQINTGVDQVVCGDAATVNISSTFSNATGVQWSNVTANGTYGSSTSANTTYNVAIPADTTAGSVTIQVATTGQLPSCPAATAQMLITFTKKPSVSAGSPITVCTDTTSIPLQGGVSVATGGTWSSPSGGTFTPNANSLNAKYIPSAADKSSGSVLLTLTTTGNGTCNAYTSDVTVTLNPKPTITGSTPQDSICTGNTISATANVTNTTSLIWKTTGTGTFSTTTGTNTVYTPSANDQSNGGVIIYASTVGSNPCKEIEKYFSITILKAPSALVNAGFDQIACADAGFFPLNGTIDGLSGTGIWTSNTGRGEFLPDATDLNPVYIADQLDIDAGGVTLTLSTTNNSICPPYSDDMILTITPAPTVSAGGSAGAFPPLCSDTAYIQLAPTITNALGGEWSTTGTGIFSPSISDLNAVYVPSAADRASGRIGLTLTTTGNGTCTPYSSFLNIRLTPKPTINIGPDKLVCADQLVDLTAATTVATGADWSSSGTGIFTASTNTLGTQYFLSDADTTNKVFNIFAKSVNQGLCKPVYDTVKITVQPIPVMFASADQSICADASTIQVSAGIANATGVLWTTNGTGTFSPNSSGNPVSYNVSQADAATGTIELYATSGNSGICSSRTDTVVVSIAPIPVVSAGAPIICETANGAALNGTVTSALTGSTAWSSSGGGVFAVNNSTLTATYYPTAADISAGSVTLTLTASNYGTCNAVTSNAILLIEPMPIANAGPDQFSCVGSQITVSANNTQAGVSYAWTDNTGTIVQPANSKSHTFTVSGNTQRVLEATDPKGCVSRDTVNIATFMLPSFTLTPPAPACYSENLLVQSNPAPQPTVPGIYQWFENGSIMTGQNKDFLIIPDTGTYKIEFSYANCSSTGQIKINPVPSVSAKDIIACGAGTLSASALPASSTITWSLNGSPSGTGNSINITSVPNDTIKYDITVQNPTTLCAARDSVYVIGLPVPQIVSLDSTSCQGLTVRLTARPTNIPNLDQFLQLSFDWRKDGGAIFSTDSVITVNALGTYRGAVSIDQCKDTSTNVIAFAAYPTSSLPEQYVYCPDTDITVTLDAGTLPNTTYKWNNESPVTTGIKIASPIEDTIYTVRITNQYNCSIKDRTTILSICAPHIDVPTAFTPGTPGGDQFFRGFGQYEQNYKLMVFNRWGEVIFVTTDKNETWDGNYLGEPMPSGVYAWIVTYEGRAQFKGPYKQTGSVTIIR